jgi:hypothetical protein
MRARALPGRIAMLAGVAEGMGDAGELIRP